MEERRVTQSRRNGGQREEQMGERWRSRKIEWMDGEREIYRWGRKLKKRM